MPEMCSDHVNGWSTSWYNFLVHIMLSSRHKTSKDTAKIMRCPVGVVRDRCHCALGMRAATESRLKQPLQDSQTWVWNYRNEIGWCWPVLDSAWSAIGDARRSNDRVCIICDCALGIRMRAATTSRLKPGPNQSKQVIKFCIDLNNSRCGNQLQPVKTYN